MKKYYNVVKAALFILLVAPLIVALKIALLVMGYPIIAVSLLFAKKEEPKPYPGRTVDDSWEYIVLQPKWVQNIWGSDKYGAQGNWFWNDEQDVTKWLPRFKWLAIRNPVSNIKNLFPFFESEAVEHGKVEYIGTKDLSGNTRGKTGMQLSWYYTKEGKFLAGFHWIKAWKNDRYTRIKFGFKLNPAKEGKVENVAISLNVHPYTKYN